MVITLAAMNSLWPHALPALRAGVAASSARVLPKYGIVTLVNLQEFMATCSEETGGGMKLVESGAYTAQRAHAVWPHLFPTVASAAPYIGDGGRKLFNYVYGVHLGRELGNRPGTDDGWNCRGRGLIELTGAAWYGKIGKATGLDLLGNPELMSSPEHALECAAAYWQIDGVNVLAAAGNFIAVTRRVNGALTNLALREEWLRTCQRVLTAETTQGL